jgi:hypothetical protein
MVFDHETQVQIQVQIDKRQAQARGYWAWANTHERSVREGRDIFDAGWRAARDYYRAESDDCREYAEREYAAVASMLAPFKLEMESLIQPTAIVPRIIERLITAEQLLEDIYAHGCAAGSAQCVQLENLLIAHGKLVS